MGASSRSIHLFGHRDMTHPVLAMGRLQELYMWDRQPLMGAGDCEMVSYAMRCGSEALAETPHCQTIDTYWNMTMQQYNIRSIACEVGTMEILNAV